MEHSAMVLPASEVFSYKSGRGHGKRKFIKGTTENVTKPY